jgi:hypothetical protein
VLNKAKVLLAMRSRAQSRKPLQSLVGFEGFIGVGVFAAYSFSKLST